MRKLQPRQRRARSRSAALLVFALAACALCAAGGAAAQSGRRRPAQKSPTPAATPEAGPQGESESKPRPSSTSADTLASFIVMGQDETSFIADSVTRNDVLESFTARLGRSPSVSVTNAGRGTRGEAHQRAKSETKAHVVLLVLEEEFGDPGPRGGRGRDRDQRSLVIRTHVYAPKTGSLKYSDTVYQRDARQTVGVGGVRLPIPTRTISRYPSQMELRQAAQEAADRLLSRFHVQTPPDNP